MGQHLVFNPEKLRCFTRSPRSLTSEFVAGLNEAREGRVCSGSVSASAALDTPSDTRSMRSRLHVRAGRCAFEDPRD